MNSFLRRLMAAAVIAGSLATLNAQETYSPSGTYQFAVKDGNQLLLDEYPASPGSVTAIDGNAKPSIVFVFGGGFKGGKRSHKEYLPWFRMLNDEGYTVLTIDYRLGMRGVRTKGGIGSVKQTRLEILVHKVEVDSYVLDSESFAMHLCVRYFACIMIAAVVERYSECYFVFVVVEQGDAVHTSAYFYYLVFYFLNCYFIVCNMSCLSEQFAQGFLHLAYCMYLDVIFACVESRNVVLG